MNLSLNEPEVTAALYLQQYDVFHGDEDALTHDGGVCREK